MNKIAVFPLIVRKERISFFFCDHVKELFFLDEWTNPFYLIYNLRMENLSMLAQKVLSMLEKDQTKWAEWTQLKDLYPVSESDAVKGFVDIIKQAKKGQDKVIVAGDYDCDGIMATTIMVRGLRKFGIECGFYIPNRIREGYGLNVDTVRLAHQRGYKIIVTVDNGVKASKALSLAKELGMKVIVTDHHTIEEDVNCELLVHPTVMEEQFHTLCGAGVAYECIRALRTDTEYELELACVASIGDVMQVTNQTRAIIQNGLKVLNREKENHLFAFASDRILNETSVGFQIVPKLNAVGRLSNLGNVNNVVRYFLSEDLKEITSMQAQINHINDLRKKMSEQMCKDALKKCHTSQPILFVNDASFHEGIIGLVAGSLSSSYQKPVIVMTNNEQGFKASMRAPDGFDCMEFLKDFSGFQEIGGHKQAAGFSIDLQDLDEFVKYIRQKIQVYSWQAKPLDTLLVNEEDISIASIESLDVMRPFGPGFVCPLFELNDVQIKSVFDIQNGKHRKFTLQSGLQCMNFNQSDLDRDKSVISIAGFIGNVQINQYRGKKQATFIIEKIKYK